MKTKLLLLLFCAGLLFLATGCYTYHGYGHSYYGGRIHMGYHPGYHHGFHHYGHHHHWHHFHH